MQVGELMLVVAVSGVVGAATYTEWARTAADARVAAEVEEVAGVAGAYRRANCQALPGAATGVSTLATAIGRSLAVEDAAAWQIRFRSPPGTGGSPRGGATFEIVYTTTSAAKRRAVAALGGDDSGTAVTLERKARTAGEHRGRRGFADMQGIQSC